jgi:fumarylacetoacetate (FAA) hydrolase
MKLATIHNNTRDGQLVVVNKQLSQAMKVPHIALTLQGALDNWSHCKPLLEEAYEALNHGSIDGSPFHLNQAMAPLPRAYQWLDGSAYVTHVELVRKARGAELPASFWTDPLMYQGASDHMMGCCEPIPLVSEEWGLDFEAEIAVITDDVPMGTTAAQANSHIQLFMLVNDVSLRNLIPAELQKGFGFVQSKPATTFSAVAVTPDELGTHWDGARVHLPVCSTLNGASFGWPNAGVDMTFGFPELIAHGAKTRDLIAGTIIGSGTVSNACLTKGSSCIAERRMLETIESGAPITPFMRYGDTVTIDVQDLQGTSIFGRIEQEVIRCEDASSNRDSKAKAI